MKSYKQFQEQAIELSPNANPEVIELAKKIELLLASNAAKGWTKEDYVKSLAKILGVNTNQL